jgi:MarR family transcriptional regulator for hemolysin
MQIADNGQSLADGNADDQLIFLLFDCSRLVRQRFEDQMLKDRLDVTFGEARSLDVVATLKSARQNDVAYHLSVDSTTVNNVLVRLERRGLITRSRDEGDRRARQISLTSDGRSFATRLHGFLSRVEADHIQQEDRKAIELRLALHRIRERLSALAGTSPGPKLRNPSAFAK